MPRFKYTVKDKDGNTVTGDNDSRSKEALVELLRKQDFTIIAIEEDQAATAKKKTATAKIKLEDLVIFTRQLATMVEAGIPLVNVLDILSEQIEKKGFSEIIAGIKNDVETGSSFSQSLAKHPKVFSQLYINMVRAGESSGLLDEILNRVATYLEKSAALQRKVKSAMVYPVAVITIAVSITIFLLIKVVPTFQGIFDMLGGELPLPTQLLLALSNFLRHWFLLGLIGFIVFVVVTAQYIKTAQGRLVFDKLMLRLPIFGDLIKKVSVAKFARTLSTLVRSGVPILGSLDIVAKTSGNKIVENTVNEAQEAIREGKNLAEPLSKSPVFPPMVVRMISVGEQAGELEKMLSKIADFYDEQVDVAVSSLTSLMEPLIIVFMGVVVGGIVLAIFMPIFKITEILG